MNGAHTQNNQAHKNNNNKKLKLKGCLCPFSGRWRGRRGGGGSVIPRLSATSQVGEEVRLSRRKQYRADTVGITHATKKPSNDVPSTRIRLFLKQQLHELSADSLVSCERKALPSKNAFSKVS